MAFLVTYELRRGGVVEAGPSNIILKKTHPVVWAANPGIEAKKARLITYLLFFAEIPDDVINGAETWCSIEI